MSIRIRKGDASDGGFILRDKGHITKREIEALILVAKGADNKTGADIMHVTVNTFRNHVQHIMQKLDAKSRASAIVRAVENDMLEIDRNKDIVVLYPSDYTLCCICERAFENDKMELGGGGKTIINNVEWELPDRLICPYEDCKSDSMLFLRWDDVISKRLEYPEIPEHGKEYDYETDWLFR